MLFFERRHIFAQHASVRVRLLAWPQFDAAKGVRERVVHGEAGLVLDGAPAFVYLQDLLGGPFVFAEQGGQRFMVPGKYP